MTETLWQWERPRVDGVGRDTLENFPACYLNWLSKKKNYMDGPVEHDMKCTGAQFCVTLLLVSCTETERCSLSFWIIQ